MMKCPECGAPAIACQARFDEFLAREFSDPDYGAVHHLTVGAFMLQHSSRLSREGWLYERGVLRKFLTAGKSPADVIKEMKRFVDSGKRNFNISSRNSKPVIDKSTWSKTISDVDAENPGAYCRDITAWARSVLGEAENIEPQAGV
jgi:hypothetical protein